MMKQNPRMVQDEDKAGAEEAVNNYMSSLAELTVNSKPHINALTFLAEDYLNYAEAIVNAVDDHLQKVPSNVKLPILYLIDSIIKNVGKDYTTLFSHSLVQSFCAMFRQVDEKTRQNMYKLRQTWNEIYSQEYLYALDVGVRALDPKWPVTATPATVLAQSTPAPHKILINPKFLQTNSTVKTPPVTSVISQQVGPAVVPVAVPTAVPTAIPTAAPNVVPAGVLTTAPIANPTVAVKANPAWPETTLATDVANTDPEVLREQLLEKKRLVLQLQQEKVDLELSQMKAKLDKKAKAVSILNDKIILEKPILPITTKDKKLSDDSITGVPVKIEDVNLETVLLEEDKKSSKQEMKKKEAQSFSSELSQIVALSNTPRITPVSPALINLVTSQRAQRDPRLAKQIKEEVVNEDASKPQGRSRDPRLTVKSEKRSRSIELEPASKSSRHRSREDSSERTSSRHTSHRDEKEKRSSDSRKSSRKADDHSSSRSKKTSSRSPSKKRSISPPSKKKSSRSPSKKTGSRSPNNKTSSHSPSKVTAGRSVSKSSKRDQRSESKHTSRKSSYGGHRPVSDIADSLESEESDSIDRAVSPLSPRLAAGSGPCNSDWAVNYTKGSHKGRNYIRKNNLPEESSEVVGSTTSSDVDLRVSAPPEKQPRLSTPSESLLQATSSAVSPGMPEQILPTIACQDVDLRCLPSSPGKKRRSAEPEEGPPPSKKNKAAFMEMLFGNQDVDLRQIDTNNGVSADASSPPPPPIISSPDGRSMLKDDSLGWSKFKQTLTPSPTVERSPAFPRSRHDRLGHSGRENDVSQNEDTDMRLPLNGLESSSKPNFNTILATAGEQVKNGIMTQSDYQKLQKQVFQMVESEKIREAQRNDYSRRDSWDKRLNHETDSNHGTGSPNNEQFGDIDERYPTSRTGKRPLLPLPSVPPVQQQEGGRFAPRYMGQRMSGPGFIRAHRAMMGPGPRGYIRGSWRFSRGSSYRHNTISLPVADNFILDKIAQDPMRTITIDGTHRDIRIYGDTAIVFMGPGADNPREISFDPGDASIVINGVVIPCSFHQPAKEVNIGGKVYRVRLGVPTRELFVNDEGFECQFGNPPREIRLSSGEVLLVQLHADVTPKVTVGQAQRTDLVAGRVGLIIDADIDNLVPIFLDAKPQRFDIDRAPHIIKFADQLETILVNNHPFNIQFGGPAVPISVHNNQHYLSLTELPRGVVPGQVEIACMEYSRKPAPPSAPAAPGRTASWPAGAATAPSALAGLAGLAGRTRSAEVEAQVQMQEEHEPALPVRGSVGVATRGMPKKIIMKPKGRRDPTESLKPVKTEGREMPAELLQAIQPGLPSLLGLLPNSTSSGYSSAGTYSGRQGGSAGPTTSTSEGTHSMTTSNTSAAESTSVGSNGIPFLAPDLDINTLFQSLYSSGIISSLSSIKDSKKDKPEGEKTKKKILAVDFKESSTMKVKQPALIDGLYSGIQCSSCGTRFPCEQTEKYSAHLDWHFRQNRRDKDSVRKPQSRKWYYDVTDWIQFEEIDDTVEKGQNWFETQQTETAKFEEAEEEEIQSVPSKEFSDGTICQLCHDKFDQFYNEEKEEWHLKDCIVADSLPYHPFCYKDYRASVESNEEVPESGTPSDAPEEVPEGAPSPSSGQDQEVSIDNIKKEPEEGVDDEEEVKQEMKMEVDTTEMPNDENEATLPIKEEAAESSILKEEAAESSILKEETAESSILEEEATEDETSTCIEKGSNEGEGIAAQEEPAIKQEKEEEGDIEEKSEVTDPIEDQSESKVFEEALANQTSPAPVTDTTSAIVSCSIDGNLELAQAPATLPSVPNRIKINISKPIVTKPREDTEDESDKASESEHEDQASVSEPIPQGEESVVLKPKLVGRKLTVLPPKVRGTETSGLCSIM